MNDSDIACVTLFGCLAALLFLGPAFIDRML